MMSATEKRDARQIEVKVSNAKHPYHFVGAGLPNVYLVGVEYSVDKVTSEQSASIPCLPALLEALAKAVIQKRGPLSADEVRFLRKRVRVPSKEFAAIVGLSSEQYSRIENESAAITPMLDRMVRFVFAALAKLNPEVAEGVARVQWQAELDHEQKIIATQDGEQWIVKTKAA